MRNYLTEQEWEAIEDAIGCTCCASLDKAEEVFGRDQCPPDEHLYDRGCLRNIKSVIAMAVETAVDRAVREYRGLPVEN